MDNFAIDLLSKFTRLVSWVSVLFLGMFELLRRQILDIPLDDNLTLVLMLAISNICMTSVIFLNREAIFPKESMGYGEIKYAPSNLHSMKATIGLVFGIICLAGWVQQELASPASAEGAMKIVLDSSILQGVFSVGFFVIGVGSVSHSCAFLLNVGLTTMKKEREESTTKRSLDWDSDIEHAIVRDGKNTEQTVRARDRINTEIGEFLVILVSARISNGKKATELDWELDDEVEEIAKSMHEHFVETYDGWPAKSIVDFSDYFCENFNERVEDLLVWMNIDRCCAQSKSGSQSELHKLYFPPKLLCNLVRNLDKDDKRLRFCFENRSPMPASRLKDERFHFKVKGRAASLLAYAVFKFGTAHQSGLQDPSGRFNRDIFTALINALNNHIFNGSQGMLDEGLSSDYFQSLPDYNLLEGFSQRQFDEFMDRCMVICANLEVSPSFPFGRGIVPEHNDEFWSEFRSELGL